MRKNMWQYIRPVCGNHDTQEEHLLELLADGSGTAFYECPVCRIRLPAGDYEKMVEHVDAMSGTIFNEMDLLGYRWKRKKVTYTIAKQDSAGHYTVRITIPGHTNKEGSSL